MFKDREQLWRVNRKNSKKIQRFSTAPVPQQIKKEEDKKPIQLVCINRGLIISSKRYSLKNPIAIIPHKRFWSLNEIIWCDPSRARLDWCKRKFEIYEYFIYQCNINFPILELFMRRGYIVTVWLELRVVFSQINVSIGQNNLNLCYYFYWGTQPVHDHWRSVCQKLRARTSRRSLDPCDTRWTPWKVAQMQIYPINSIW